MGLDVYCIAAGRAGGSRSTPEGDTWQGVGVKPFEDTLKDVLKVSGDAGEAAIRIIQTV